ncbi:MAG: hypothetical protein JSR77_16255 [Planctomycetes bacterium]|nr:hypothetical protein [Planctomycetota bacterium]
MKALFAIAAVHMLASVSLGQAVVDSAHAMAWSENAGYLNWDAAQGTDAVYFAATYASGWVWNENVGWINLGQGPLNGMSYANTNGLDFGLNIAPNGALTGYAWGENIGWINMSGGAMATPANAARLDMINLRLRGYAWGENIGWINLDDAGKFVGLTPPACPADFNQDGGIDGSDVQAFFAAWESGDFAADVNLDGGIDGADVETFFAAWEAGGC